MNFSEGGCCNRYIARTLLQQCWRAKPDLVIAHFTYITRQETLIPATVSPTLYSQGENWLNVATTGWGRWLDVGLVKRELAIVRYRGARRRWARSLARRIRAYFRHYEPLAAAYDTFQQMLLLQLFLSANGIEYVFCLHDAKELQNARADGNGAVAALYDILDHGRIGRVSMSDPDFRLDIAADNYHQGQESNRKFADALWHEYLSRCAKRVSSDVGLLLAGRVRV
jgi:hypothetical protein